MRPAVELSYLDEDSQREVVDQIDLQDCTPSQDQAIRMRKAMQEGDLSPDDIMLSCVNKNLIGVRELFLVSTRLKSTSHYVCL